MQRAEGPLARCAIASSPQVIFQFDNYFYIFFSVDFSTQVDAESVTKQNRGFTTASKRRGCVTHYTHKRTSMCL